MGSKSRKNKRLQEEQRRIEARRVRGELMSNPEKSKFEIGTRFTSHNVMLKELHSSGYIILTSANAKNVTPFGKESKILSNGNLWHKIFVLNAEYLDREFVLKTIIESVYPNDLIPVSYTVDGIITSFITRNCGPAITQLAKQNFVIANPERAHLKSKRPFLIQVVLAFSNKTKTQLNVGDNIMSALNRRYSQTTKVLNLEMFHKDTYLSNLIFCVLWQPKILYFVLDLAKNLILHTLKLNNNEIRNITPLEILSSCKTLVCLDLGNNLIDSIAALYPLKTTSVTELWIEGNPLCEHYNKITYIEAVKLVCPAIVNLDGVLVAQRLPSFQRNYLIDNEAQGFINQFLEHFFSFYDSNNRKCLEGLYHPEAKFSLTCNYIPNQATSATARLLDYKSVSRNLIASFDILKCKTSLSYGANVINRLCSLPITEHDPPSFTVDCVHYSESQVILVVNGIFRETSETLLEVDRILGFCRTFVLKAGLNGEWNIINDMLHVSNATTVMAQEAFKFSKTSKLLRFDHTLILEAQSLSDKERMVDAFKKVTTLNQEWSNKCLEESKWNFLGALTIFVDLYKIDKMPDIAFEG